MDLTPTFIISLLFRIFGYIFHLKFRIVNFSFQKNPVGIFIGLIFIG